jgi:pimeloyl-ACP methyl ester carboxylesterase
LGQSAVIKEDWVHAPLGRLSFRRWVPSGAGDAPIVLFHDSLGCVDAWREFPERLSASTGREVIAYDRLGFGRSDPHPGRLTLDFIGDEARGSFSALRSQLGLERFVAFGHSVGGAMAAVCAARFPAECRALITEGAQAFVEDRTLESIRAAEKAFAREDQFARLKKHHGDKSAWVLEAWVGAWLADGFERWSLDGDMPLVRCPVLAVHGEHDEFGSLLQPERFASLAARPAATEILPGCGHVPHREKQGALIDAVKAFLARHAG